MTEEEWNDLTKDPQGDWIEYWSNLEDHDCWDNAQPYEFEEEGHRFHGWEWGVCGELLQTG